MTVHGKTARGSLTDEQIDFYDREGYLVLPHLVNEDDLASVRQAMQQKVDMIADALWADGLIDDKVDDASFENRLALLVHSLFGEVGPEKHVGVDLQGEIKILVRERDDEVGPVGRGIAVEISTVLFHRRPQFLAGHFFSAPE